MSEMHRTSKKYLICNVVRKECIVTKIKPLGKIVTIQNQAPQTDEQLLAYFVRTGEQDALAKLFLRYSDLVYGVCYKYLNDGEMAKDAVMNIYQELVVKVAKSQVVNFKSWLYVVAKNHCLMQLRASKKSLTVPLENQVVQSGDFSHLESVMEREDEFRKLEKCIETLSAEQQQSIRMFYYDNKCYNEIAEETGLEWNKIRSLIQNGRRNLKICMEQNGG